MKSKSLLGMYILDRNGKPKPEKDVIKWGQWMQTGNRRVALSYTKNYHVSTVFMGLDHAFSGGKPILYETLVFENKTSEMKVGKGKTKFHKTLDVGGMGERYHSRKEALNGHDKIVRKLETYEGIPKKRKTVRKTGG